MRAETQKRLLALLEADIQKLEENLNVDKCYDELKEADKQVDEIFEKLRGCKNMLSYAVLEADYEKAKRRQKRAAQKCDALSGNIPKWVTEQSKLKDDLQELKSILTYARPDLATKY